MAGSKRGVQASLSREMVVRTAFEIADRVGPDSVSLRMVAEKLNITTMGLYTYIDSKEDLMNGIYDLYFREFDQRRIPGELWEDTFRRFGMNNAAVATRHPRIAAALCKEPLWGKARFGYARRISSVYLEQGMDPAILGQSWAIYDGLLNAFIAGLLNSCTFGEAHGEDPDLEDFIERMAEAYNDCSIEENWEIAIQGFKQKAGPICETWRTPAE